MSRRPGVLILGGGPAGLGAAFWLSKRGFRPVVVEARERVGGNAGSFELEGLPVDYGSHRLHPATDPEILGTLKELLGPDLVVRPRHGRILLKGRWLHFPLKPMDLARSAPPSFIMGVVRDAGSKLLKAGRGRGAGSRSAPGRTGGPTTVPEPGESFASVLWEGLGPTVCREFYFPYARKIWGLEPEAISPVQAVKRVGSNSLGALLGRLLPRGRPGSGSGPKGVFFYPRNGFGQISRSLSEAAERQGAEIILEAPVREIRVGGSGGGEVRIHRSGQDSILPWDHLWSTLPLGLMAGMIRPSPPEEVLSAAGALETRAMILLYLVLDTNRFTEFDAHYFPSGDIPFTRMSEPKNYSGREDPMGRTVLCVEIPCFREEPIWRAGDESLRELVVEGLARAGLEVRVPIMGVESRRLPAAYPLYRMGYEEHFQRVDEWMESVPGLLSFGRQGLFAHDNTHHALAMARAAVHCLGDDGRFHGERWSAYRELFSTHVVED